PAKRALQYMVAALEVARDIRNRGARLLELTGPGAVVASHDQSQMKLIMPPYRKLGSIPPKRHIAHRHEPGYRDEGIYYEEVVTTAGFGRAYSIAYHLRPPTRVRKVEAAGTVALDTVAEPALRHHHLKTGPMKASGDPVTGRVPLLVNDDVALLRCRPAKPQAELFRNATADEVLFIHKGRGTLQTMFGVLPFRPFDYIVIPH